MQPISPARADVSHLLDSLNEAQRQAVAAPLEHLLVLAGAGSGKTRVLIHRIAWLLEVHGVSPYGILAVTFTNKAAHEIRNRLQQLLKHSAQGMWVGTFHGLAHRLLRRHWQEAGLPEGFQILDSEDQLRALRRVLKSLELDEKKWPPKQAQWFINKHKDEGLRPNRIEVLHNRFEQQMVQIYQVYQEYCDRSGLLDFAELLLRSYELWNKHPEILAHYQQRFNHLLIDEFQDTNTLQYRWVRLLAGESNKVFAVGDDDQSIYGWRGARVENLHRFQQEFADSRLVRLEQNYRSTNIILQAANALIAHNSERLGKNLWTDGGDGEPIALYCAYNDLDEASFITSRIQDWVERGGHYKECALLYRSNAQSRVLEESLVQRGIPYRVYGGLRFFERQEIKDALAYLRLVANRDDDGAFERIVNHPPRGLGERSVENLRVSARRHGLSLWQAAHAALAGGELSGRAHSALAGFMSLIDQASQRSFELPLGELTEKMLKASGLREHYEKQKSEKDQMRVENLDELVNATREFQQQYHEDSLAPLNAFLSHTALDAGEEQNGGSPLDSVQLMTLHSAKGLEFPLVFLCGMEDNLFPHSLALQDPNGLEEERRLCYVGMTRAMRQLYLTYAQVRRLHGKESRSLVSRFVAEIPTELTQEVRLRSVNPRSTYTPPVHSGSSSGPGSFKTGQRVYHPKFGKGIVLASEGRGETERVQVDFGWEGKKWLVAGFANLELVG